MKTFAFDLFASANVSPGVTVLFALLLAGLIVCLALEEKLHAKKSVIAGAFAVLCLLFGAAFGVLPLEEIVIGSGEVTRVENGSVDLVYENHTGEHKLHVDPYDVEAEQDKSAEAAPPDSQSSPAEKPAKHPELHVGGEERHMPVYIPAIEWSVIAIILGSSLFVDVTSRSGLFTWIAIRMTKLSGGDPFKLLAYYGSLTVIFSAVLNNVTAMIIIGSLTAVSLDKLGRRDKLLAFLLIEGMLTNIGGLLTLISSVPNIIVGAAAGISFVEFFIKAAPYVVVATVATIWLGAKLFAIRSLESDEEQAQAAKLVAGFDETDGVDSWGFFWFAAAMLLLFIALIAATSSGMPVLKDLGMGFVALAFAAVMLVRYKSSVDQFYRAIDWDLLAFFTGLFVVIYVMEHAAVLTAIGQGLQAVLGDVRATTAGVADSAILLVGSAAFSSVTDNIPLSAMLAKILQSLGAPSESGLWWSVIFGSNLGGNLTPIGSASTLVAVTIIHKHKLHLTFMGFVKKAFPFAVLHIVLAVIYVALFLR